MYALDTNSLIYFFKGMGRAAERVLGTPPRSLAIPAVVLYEVEVGIAKSSSPARRRFQLEQLLALLDVPSRTGIELAQPGPLTPLRKPPRWPVRVTRRTARSSTGQR